MAIQSSEIIWKKPQEDSDSASNGGRITAVVSPDNTAGNDFPDVPQSELTSGKTRYRKRFIKIANDADLTAQSTKVYLRKHTPAQDAALFFPASQRNTQADITGTERLYGAGQLAANVSAGAASITVNTEGATFNYFQTGDTIVISDKGSVFGSGNRELAVISGAVSYSGDQATINLTAPLAYAYQASNTVVSSVYNAGDVKASADNYAVASASGTFDSVNHPVIIDHIGSMEQTWTVTFTGATTFGVVGDTIGSVGSGSTGSDFAPANASEGNKPYFTIPSAGWGGAWASGDTLVFQTHPCAVAIWYKQVIPAGCAAFSGNTPYLAVMLQSA